MASNTATSSINFTTAGKLMTGQVSEAVVPNVLRSQMDSGFPKQTKRSSKAIINREVTYLFSDAEYATFQTWWHDTAADGALMFNYTDPMANNNIVDARIIEGVYQAQPVTARSNYWWVKFTMELYR